MSIASKASYLARRAPLERTSQQFIALVTSRTNTMEDANRCNEVSGVPVLSSLYQEHLT